jgi:hypothetical protein
MKFLIALTVAAVTIAVPAFAQKQTFTAQPDEEKHGKPGLWLVKDQGLYLMSPGVPNLPDPKNPSRNLVVHAKEAGPSVHIRGDDYVEFLEIEGFTDAVAAGVDEILITISRNSISLGWLEPPKPVTRNAVRAQIEEMLSKSPGLAIVVGIKKGARKVSVTRYQRSFDQLNEGDKAKINHSFRSYLLFPNNRQPITESEIDAFAKILAYKIVQ